MHDCVGWWSQVSQYLLDFPISEDYRSPSYTDPWCWNYPARDPQLEALRRLSLVMETALTTDESKMGEKHNVQLIPDGEMIEKDVHQEGEATHGAWVYRPNHEGLVLAELAEVPYRVQRRWIEPMIDGEQWCQSSCRS